MEQLIKNPNIVALYICLWLSVSLSCYGATFGFWWLTRKLDTRLNKLIRAVAILIAVFGTVRLLITVAAILRDYGYSGTIEFVESGLTVLSTLMNVLFFLCLAIIANLFAYRAPKSGTIENHHVAETIDVFANLKKAISKSNAG